MPVAQQHRISCRCQRGSTLLELLVAMLVLATGLGAITTLLFAAIASNSRNNRDTTATLLAQMVMEEISAQNIFAGGGPITNIDCAGTLHQFSPAAGPVGTGSGAALKADGTIDFTQAIGAIPLDYSMVYADCSNAGGAQMMYEVRWNVMSVSANATTRMITVAARPLTTNTQQMGSLTLALPITLRGIGAPTVGK